MRLGPLLHLTLELIARATPRHQDGAPGIAAEVRTTRDGADDVAAASPTSPDARDRKVATMQPASNFARTTRVVALPNPIDDAPAAHTHRRAISYPVGQPLSRRAALWRLIVPQRARRGVESASARATPVASRARRGVDDAMIASSELRARLREVEDRAQRTLGEAIADALEHYEAMSEEAGADTVRAALLRTINQEIVGFGMRQTALIPELRLAPLLAALPTRILTQLDALYWRAPRILHMTWIGPIPEIVQDYMRLHASVNGASYRYRLWHDPEATLAPTLGHRIREHAAAEKMIFAMPVEERGRDRRARIDRTETRVYTRAIALQNMAWESIAAAMRNGASFDEAAIAFMTDYLGADRDELIEIRARARESVARLEARIAALGGENGPKLETRAIQAELLEGERLEGRGAMLRKNYLLELGLRNNPAAASDIVRVAALFEEGGVHVDGDTLPAIRPEVFPGVAGLAAEVRAKLIMTGDKGNLRIAGRLNMLVAHAQYQALLDQFPSLLPARAARRPGYRDAFADLATLGAGGQALADAIRDAAARAGQSRAPGVDTVERLFLPLGSVHAGTLGYSMTVLRDLHFARGNNNNIMTGVREAEQIGYLLDRMIDHYALIRANPDVMLDIDHFNRDDLEVILALRDSPEADATQIVKRDRIAWRETRPTHWYREPKIKFKLPLTFRLDGLHRHARSTIAITGPNALTDGQYEYIGASISTTDLDALQLGEEALHDGARRAHAMLPDAAVHRYHPTYESLEVNELGEMTSTEEGEHSDFIRDAIVRPSAYDTSTRYDAILNVQLGSGRQVGRAARFMFNRHFDRTTWLAVDDDGRTIEVVQDARGLPAGRVRLNLIGHGDARATDATLSGFTGEQVAELIHGWRGRFYDKAVTIERISIVGCHAGCELDVMGGTVREGFAHDLLVGLMANDRTPMELSLRSGALFVDVWGRKHLQADVRTGDAMKFLVMPDGRGGFAYRPAEAVNRRPLRLGQPTEPEADTQGRAATRRRLMPARIPTGAAGPLAAAETVARFEAVSLEARRWSARLEAAARAGRPTAALASRAANRVIGHFQSLRTLLDADQLRRAFDGLGDGDRASEIRGYLNLAQSVHDLGNGASDAAASMRDWLGDATNLAGDAAREAGTLRRLLGRANQGLAGAFGIANVGFDVYELAHADADESALAGARLGLDLAGTAAWAGEAFAVAIGSELLADALGPIGLLVTLGAIGVGVAEDMHQQHTLEVAREAAAAEVLLQIDAVYRDAPVRRDNGTGLLSFAPGVIVEHIDLRTGRARFGSAQIAAVPGAAQLFKLLSRQAGIVAALDQARLKARIAALRAQQIREHEMLPAPRLAAILDLPTHSPLPDTNHTLLPVMPRLRYEISTAPPDTVRARLAEAGVAPAALTLLERIRNGFNAWMRSHAPIAFQVWRPDELISALFANVEPISVRLDLPDRAQVLIGQTPPTAWHNKIEYRIFGRGAPCLIVPAPGTRFRLADDAATPTSWLVDARNLTDTRISVRQAGNDTEIRIGTVRLVAASPDAAIAMIDAQGQRKRIHPRTGACSEGGIDANGAAPDRLVARLGELADQAEAARLDTQDMAIAIEGLRDPRGRPLEAWFVPAGRGVALAPTATDTVAPTLVAVAAARGEAWVLDGVQGSLHRQDLLPLHWLPTCFETGGRLRAACSPMIAGPSLALPTRISEAVPLPGGRARITLESGERLRLTPEGELRLTGVSPSWTALHARSLVASLQRLCLRFEPATAVVVERPGGERWHFDPADHRLHRFGELATREDFHYLGSSGEAGWAVRGGELWSTTGASPDLRRHGVFGEALRLGGSLLLANWTLPAGEALAPPKLAGVHTLVLAPESGERTLQLSAAVLEHHRDITIDSVCPHGRLALRLDIDATLPTQDWSRDGDDFVATWPGEAEIAERGSDTATSATRRLRIVDAFRERAADEGELDLAVYAFDEEGAPYQLPVPAPGLTREI